MRRLLAGVTFAAVSFAAATASAHLTMDAPTNRYGEQQKQPPCGVTDGLPSETVTVFEPGETITVTWRETINHPSHYRISFSPNGDQDFVDPATADEMYSNEYVLLDGIPDVADPNYAIEVTLPDVECETCVLQVIQVMYDKPPYTIPGNDIYYNCSDLALRVGGDGLDDPQDETGDEPADEDPADADPSQPGEIGGGAACHVAGSASGASTGALALLVLAALRRRRHQR